MRLLSVGWTVFLATLLILVPTLVSRSCQVQVTEATPAAEPVLQLAVYLPNERRIVQMSLADYLVRVVAGELPPEFADGALEAQMVAARTYTVKNIRRFGGRGCVLHPRADACAAHEVGQAYADLPDLEQRLGRFTARRFWQRLQAAEQATRNLIITYQGQPIEAVYHSSSGELTDTAAAEWGSDLPYLQPVPDPWGKEAPRYTETVSLTPAEVARALGLKDLAVPAGSGEPPIAVLERTPGGRAARIQVGSLVLSGRDLRARLGLRSTRFTSRIADGRVAITTYGYGHGVGMSQYGANGLARRGHDFRQILAHYYPGTRIEPIFAE